MEQTGLLFFFLSVSEVEEKRKTTYTHVQSHRALGYVPVLQESLHGTFWYPLLPCNSGMLLDFQVFCLLNGPCSGHFEKWIPIPCVFFVGWLFCYILLVGWFVCLC